MPQGSVFIVEGELIEVKDISQIMETQVYEVTGIAQTGSWHLEVLKKKHPGLCLMNIHLAGNMDGVDTVERIRAL